MKWTITLESHSFGFKATIDNDGVEYVGYGRSADEVIRKLSQWIARQPLPLIPRPTEMK